MGSIADLEQTLKDAREIELTVTGRKTGNLSARPVWFTEDGGTMYLLPVGGSGSNWYKNLLKTPRIRLAAGGAEADAESKPITEATEVSDVLGRFRDKYGDSDVERFYPGQDVAVAASLA